MGILEVLGNLFGGVKEFFGFQSKKLDLNNSPDIKKSKINKEEQKLIDKSNNDIQNKNIEEIRKQLSE